MTKMDDSAIYFLDRDLARETALKKNNFKVGGVYDIRQICYYDGFSFEDAPDNLINVPVEKFAEYFSTTGLRLPLKFIGKDAEDHAMGSILAHSLEEIRKTRNFYRDFYANILLRNKPDFINDKPLRIYLPTSRWAEEFPRSVIVKDSSRPGSPAIFQNVRYLSIQVSSLWYY